MQRGVFEAEYAGDVTLSLVHWHVYQALALAARFSVLVVMAMRRSSFLVLAPAAEGLGATSQSVIVLLISKAFELEASPHVILLHENGVLGYATAARPLEKVGKSILRIWRSEWAQKSMSDDRPRVNVGGGCRHGGRRTQIAWH